MEERAISIVGVVVPPISRAAQDRGFVIDARAIQLRALRGPQVGWICPFTLLMSDWEDAPAYEPVPGCCGSVNEKKSSITPIAAVG